MKICIIGWYGTETIGDRAILAGIFSFFSKAYNDFSIELGSLYPFFSQRTIKEDQEFWNKITGRPISVNLFDSKNYHELDQAIKNCDLLIMGGGPLMDISPMYMIEYAFRKAKQIGVKSIIYGCGIGPLFSAEFKKCTLNIIESTDSVVLRDTCSKENLWKIASEFRVEFPHEKILVSLDPAVEACLNFRKHYKANKSNYIAVNLRSFPQEYSLNNSVSDVNETLEKFLGKITEIFKDREIKLVPMHYFHIGNDDRIFLSKIQARLERENLTLTNVPATLLETMFLFAESDYSFGMRFHSVVLQTMLNGKNYILDYTEPNTGKISGFIRDIAINELYQNRYVNLQQTSEDNFLNRLCDDLFLPDTELLDSKLNIYRELL